MTKGQIKMRDKAKRAQSVNPKSLDMLCLRIMESVGYKTINHWTIPSDFYNSQLSGAGNDQTRMFVPWFRTRRKFALKKLMSCSGDSDFGHVVCYYMCCHTVFSHSQGVKKRLLASDSFVTKHVACEFEQWILAIDGGDYRLIEDAIVKMKATQNLSQYLTDLAVHIIDIWVDK